MQVFFKQFFSSAMWKYGNHKSSRIVQCSALPRAINLFLMKWIWNKLLVFIHFTHSLMIGELLQEINISTCFIFYLVEMHCNLMTAIRWLFCYAKQMNLHDSQNGHESSERCIQLTHKHKHTVCIMTVNYSRSIPPTCFR